MPPTTQRRTKPSGSTDVFSSLLHRLTAVESQLRTAQSQIQIKDATIENLQRDLEFQKSLLKTKENDDRFDALQKECRNYEAQVLEMQAFLQNHGMIWKNEGYVLGNG